MTHKTIRRALWQIAGIYTVVIILAHLIDRF